MLVWNTLTSDDDMYYVYVLGGSNFAIMLYCLTTEFKQKERKVLKSNHSWTVWEIITLYTFVSTVKYAEEYWVSKTYH